MNSTLRKRLKIVHDRGIESLEDGIFHRANGDHVTATKYVGRYQGYHDAWVLLNHLLLQSEKGGD